MEAEFQKALHELGKKMRVTPSTMTDVTHGRQSTEWVATYFWHTGKGSRLVHAIRTRLGEP